MKLSICSFLSVLLFLFLSFETNAQAFPAGFSKVEVTNGMVNPTAMAMAPDGRIFIAQQNGVLHVIKNGVRLPTPAIQIAVNTSGERGLVGITLHPSFSTNGLVYLYYTLPNASRNRVSRFYMKGDVINPTTEQIIYDLDPLTSSPYHNGGAMHFVGDRLFIAVGDNSLGANAQNLETTKGKILRINANGSIPGDNPFYSLTNSRQKNSIWAYGFRNPFTFDVQPGTNRIFVNDVGQEGWEEINDITVKGKNFGWPSTEGKTTNTAFTSPFYAYAHGTGDGVGCAITGGVFFSPPVTNYPASLIGTYFFLDYCNSWINYIDFSSGTPVRNSFATGQPGQMLAIDVGSDGNLYFLSRAGRLYRIRYNSSQPPVISDQPDNLTVSTGQTATFTVSATGALPLNYQWKKGGVNITGANSATYSITNTQPSHAGNYTVTVSNSFGNETSSVAVLTVSGSNTAPTASITLPATGSMYRGGEVISFSGDGNDAEDGALPASAFAWYAELHHDQHYHDSPPIAEGTKSGTYTIPSIGETSINVFYRLILKVTDSQGLISTSFVDLKPNISIMALQSTPGGLSMTMDGQPFTALSSIRSVEGVQRTIGVVTPQTTNGTTYLFSSWAHGGPDAQTLSTPIDNTMYTANFSKPLDAPWRTTNIGKQNVPGTGSMTGGTFTVSASGRDIYNNDDHFGFIYQTITGDCDIRARLTGLTNTHAWAKAGVMIRENLQPESRNAMTLISPTSGASFQRRIAAAGPTTAVNAPGSAPYWVRLVRSGNNISSYVSSDGAAWTPVGTAISISMSSTVYVGVAVTSHSSSALCTATFTDVLATPGAAAAGFEAEQISFHSTSGLTIFPNPVDGEILNVSMPGKHVLRSVQIVNSVGQIVLEKPIESSDVSSEAFEVNVGGVTPGFYSLRVQTDGKGMSGSFLRK